MTQERLDYLLDQHYKNALSAAEREELEGWYHSMQQGQPGLYNNTGSAEEQGMLEEMATGLMQRVDEIDESRIKGKRRTMWARWSIAASIVLVLGSMFTFSLFRKSNIEKTGEIAAAGNAETRQTFTAFENDSEEDARYTLPDSTSVVLSAHSAISFDSNYNVIARNISLKGKGFFKVKKDATRPFTVYSKQITTTALGTAFTVTAYENDTVVNVVLHEGKVRVKPVASREESNNDVVYLEAGDKVSFNTNTFIASAVTREIKNGRAEDVASKPATVLTAGKTITFEQEPLHKVFDKLARIYHVSIAYQLSDIREMDFSGTIRPDDQLMAVLQRIILLNNLSVKSGNGKYVITRQ